MRTGNTRDPHTAAPAGLSTTRRDPRARIAVPLATQPRSQALSPQGPEYAGTLIPWWVLALAACAIATFAIQSNTDSRPQATGVSVPPPIPWQACGAGWQLRHPDILTIEAQTLSSYDLRLGPPQCSIHLHAGISSLGIHVSGKGLIVANGPSLQYITPIAASGWWSMPVDARGDTLVLQPAPGNGDVSVVMSMQRP